MKFEIGKIILVESISKIEILVHITETDKESARQKASVTVYLDNKNQTLSELKTEAEKAARGFLAGAISGKAAAGEK